MSDKILSVLWGEKDERSEIIEVRKHAYNWIVKPVIIFGFFLTALACLQAYRQGQTVFSAIFAGCYIILAGTVLPGYRVSISTRSMSLVLLLFVLSVSGLIRIGLSGLGQELLLLSCATSSALLGRRIGLFFIGISVLAIFLIGGGMVFGILPVRQELLLTSLSPLAWGTSLVAFPLFAIGLVAIPQMFHLRLKESLVLLEEHAEKLERSNASMKETIKAREEAEKGLKESEDRFKTVLENLPGSVFAHDLEGNYLFVNEVALANTGYSREELLAMSVSDTDPSSVQRDDRNRVWHNIKVGKSITIETTQIKKDGSKFPAEIHLNAMELDGKPIIVSIVFDISERKRSEREQANLKRKLANAIDMAHLGPWEYDVSSGLFTFNDHFYKIFGTTAWQIGGYTMSSIEYARRLVHPDDFSIVAESIKKAIEATDPHFNLQLEHKILCADGSEGCITVRIFIVKDANGKTVKIYGVNQNITERKRAEERLRKSEEKLARSRKMEALGLLAGGVAHDLNNILAGVINYPELLLLNLPKDSDLRKPLEVIQQTGNRAVAVVQDLLTVARGVAIEKKPLNLNNVIAAYIESAEHKKLLQYHPMVTVGVDLDPQLLNIKGSGIHIGKAVMNLVSNASEAITGNGKVSLSTSNRYIDQPLKGYEDVIIGEYVVLIVADSGPGISPDDLSRIFEPFYTKKVMGRSGTGLGLAVVWNVIQDHKGYIDITTNENGTTFELFFPITRDEIFKEGITLSFEDYKGNGETVLIVDDVESQRDISCKMLEMLGYKSIPISSGEKAVEFVKNNEVDIILLDMIMDPGINGRETYERILKTHPKQKAIIISGFAETDEVKRVQQLGAGKYLRKPVLLEKLGLAIKEELARKHL